MIEESNESSEKNGNLYGWVRDLVFKYFLPIPLILSLTKGKKFILALTGGKGLIYIHILFYKGN
jgi:hypothetical protein